MTFSNHRSHADEESPAAVSGAMVQRIIDGDRTAEAELVARYARGIRVIISRASSDRAAVDDLCQETFRIALEKVRRGDVRDPDRLAGFICSLARNLVVDHFPSCHADRRRASSPTGRIRRRIRSVGCWLANRRRRSELSWQSSVPHAIAKSC